MIFILLISDLELDISIARNASHNTRFPIVIHVNFCLEIKFINHSILFMIVFIKYKFKIIEKIIVLIIITSLKFYGFQSFYKRFLLQF